MSEDPMESLLRKLLTGGYADLSACGRGAILLVDSSWVKVTGEEAAVAKAIWGEDAKE